MSNPSSEFAEIIQDYMDKSLRGITVGCIARIESHDTSKMRADVTPLLLAVDSEKSTTAAFAVVPDVPVGFIHAGGFIIRPKYKKGDLVWLSFATHSIEKGLAGSSDRTDGRIFSAENACITHGLAGTSFSAPSDFGSDGLLICNESGDTVWALEDGKVRIKSTAVEIEGDITVKGKITQTGDFETSGDVKTDKDVTWLAKSTPTKASTHIHGTGVGPTAAPNPGS